MAEQSKVVKKDFVIGDERGYIRFITELRDLLATPHCENVGNDHPVLPRQRAKQPARWFHIKLVVRGSRASPTIAIRDDNVYFKGFKNWRGDWYELTDPTECSARMLPPEYEARRVDCGVSYRSILNVTGKRIVPALRSLRLDRALLMDGAESMWWYGDVTTVDGDTRWALAGVIIMICECARMTSHYETVVGGWVFGGPCLTRNQILYLWHWTHMSRALLRWKRDEYRTWPTNRKLESINIMNQDDALRVVKLVLNLPQVLVESASIAQGADSPDGRPCVEVLAVSANFSVLGTTITVFNGKRGQIIYKNEDDQERPVGSSMVDLVLTGPYRTISVYGNFAIQVDIPVTAGGEDESSSSGGGLLSAGRRSIYWEWDGYDRDGYGKEVKDTPELVQRTINGGEEYPDCNINVTYAVIANALEANVQVRLRLPGDGSSDDTTVVVYGTITARAECFDLGSILFDRDERRTLRLPSGGSSILPLARSVVAVPFDCTLRVQVQLTIADGDNTRRDPRQIQGSVDFSGGSPKQTLESEAGSVEVDITWYPGYPEFTADTATTSGTTEQE